MTQEVIDINKIREIIPHRYPFLLIDRITYLEPGAKAVGYKNVTTNEPFFQGHFPGNPIMPGVLIVEALAQLGCVAMLIKEEYKNMIGLFAGIDGVRFKRPVYPGVGSSLFAGCSRKRCQFQRRVWKQSA